MLYIVLELISKLKNAVCKLDDECPRLVGKNDLCYLNCFAFCSGVFPVKLLIPLKVSPKLHL